MATILFDQASIFSYVLVRFALGLYLIYDIHNSPIYISTLVRDFMVMTHV